VAKFDERSETNIATLNPDAQKQASVFLAKVRAAGIDARILGGSRTFEEQDELFAQGRTKPGPIVTNARGGFSNHNFGIAWDIGVFSGKDFLEDSPLYDIAGRIEKDIGLEWGGDFRSIVDKPHFQCRTGKTLSQLRELVLAGEPITVLPLTLPIEITVRVNEQTADIPALFIASRTFVGVRRFVARFGGVIAQAGGDPFLVTVALDEDTEKEITGQIIDGMGYVKFADLNELYSLPFVFDSAKRQLDITLEKVV